MSFSFYEEYLNIPAIKRFLGVLEEDLIQRRSILVILPYGIDGTLLWSKISTAIWRRSLIYCDISVPKDLDGDYPLSVLCKSFGIKNENLEEQITLQELLEAGNLPDVILIEGLDSISDNGFRNWMKLFELWGESNQMIANKGGSTTALCALLQNPRSLSTLPENDLYLGVHWWWGFPSILENKLFCRTGNIFGENGDIGTWRESILPSIAIGDVELFEKLWEIDQINPKQINMILMDVASNRGWNAEKIVEWGIEQVYQENNNQQWTKIPPRKLQLLWANGVLNATLEHGIEINSAALALLGKTEMLKHRLWSGQAELLLPLLDNVRLKICQQLTEWMGPDWPIRWHKPDSQEELVDVREDPLAVQFGYLEWLIRYSDHFRGCRNLLPVVTMGRHLRNHIAHYRPIAYQDYVSFHRQIQQLSI